MSSRYPTRATRAFPVPPSSREYATAFEAIRPQLSNVHLSLLRAHYGEPGHVATVQRLAGLCGIASWRTVNRQYGELAKLLLMEMGYERPHNEDGDLWLTGLCFWYESMQMHLRPEVVKAIRRLRWVD